MSVLGGKPTVVTGNPGVIVTPLLLVTSSKLGLGTNMPLVISLPLLTSSKSGLKPNIPPADLTSSPSLPELLEGRNSRDVTS